MHITACGDGCRGSEALLTRQAAALVKGVDLVAGLRNRLQMLLELHAAAGLPITQQALALFASSRRLAKGGRRGVGSGKGGGGGVRGGAVEGLEKGGELVGEGWPVQNSGFRGCWGLLQCLSSHGGRGASVGS